MTLMSVSVDHFAKFASRAHQNSLDSKPAPRVKPTLPPRGAQRSALASRPERYRFCGRLGYASPVSAHDAYPSRVPGEGVRS